MSHSKNATHSSLCSLCVKLPVEVGQMVVEIGQTDRKGQGLGGLALAWLRPEEHH